MGGNELERLGRLLRPSEQLLCLAPAVHRTNDGSRSRRVWLGVGQTKSRGDHAVFIFTRTRFACAQRLREWIYCVLPVVANVQVDIQESRCVFSWSAKAKMARLRYQSVEVSRLPGDCLIEEVLDQSGVLQVLQQSHEEACQRSLVFHGYIHGTSERMNHRELWQYRDAIPLDLAKLQPTQVTTGHSRGTKSPGMLSRSMTVRQSTGTETLRLLCVTWNVGATLPIEDQSLTQLLSEESAADVVCIGFQEVCAFTIKRVALKDGEEWMEWRSWAEQGIEAAYNGELELLQDKHLVGLLLLIFVRKRMKTQVSDVRACVIPTGVGGVGGNKGAVCARFEIGSTSLCFVNAHLAAGQEHYIERCQHFRTIIERIMFRHADDNPDEDPSSSCEPESFTYRKSFVRDASRSMIMAAGDALQTRVQTEVYTVHDHDHIFWLGDTNSRLHWPGQLGGMPIEQAVQKVRERRIGELLALDQLNLMRRDGMAFDGFEELPIHFLPSYKWRPGGDALDMRSQKHVPAWTDRILFRSQTRPPAEAFRYDMHLGLKQSDHRPVFSCFSVPWEGSTEKDPCSSLQPLSSSSSAQFPHEAAEAEMSVRGSLRGDNEEPSLSLQPCEASFLGTKPDRTRDCPLKLTLSGGSGSATFKVFIISPSGELESVASNLADMNCREQTSRAEEGDGLLLSRWLSVSPSSGRIERGETKEVRVSLCVCVEVLKRQEAEASLVFCLGDRPPAAATRGNCRLSVRVVLEPSVMRMSLASLAALGSQPILAAESTASPAASEALLSSPSGVCLPPKEVMAVMQWVLRQSRDEAPGSLHWWPDPLLDGARKGQDELYELQRYVENGWPLPTNSPQLPARSAAVFLLRWLTVLPEPVLPPSIADQFKKDTELNEILRGVAALPRCVIVCVTSLFAQLSQRHSGGNDAGYAQRLAGCLTQQVPPSATAEQLLNAMILEFRSDATWPPMSYLAAAL